MASTSNVRKPAMALTVQNRQQQGQQQQQQRIVNPQAPLSSRAPQTQVAPPLPKLQALNLGLMDWDRDVNIVWTVNGRGVITGTFEPRVAKGQPLCVMVGSFSMQNGLSERAGTTKPTDGRKPFKYAIPSVDASFRRDKNSAGINALASFEEWYHAKTRADWTTVIYPKLPLRHQWKKPNIKPEMVLNNETMIIPDVEYPIYKTKEKEVKEGEQKGVENKHQQDIISDAMPEATPSDDGSIEALEKVLNEGGGGGGEGEVPVDGNGEGNVEQEQVGGGGGGQGEPDNGQAVPMDENGLEQKEDKDDDTHYHNGSFALPKPGEMLQKLRFEKSDPQFSVARWRDLIGVWTIKDGTINPKTGKPNMKKPIGKGLQAKDAMVYFESIVMNPASKTQVTINATVQKFIGLFPMGRQLVNPDQYATSDSSTPSEVSSGVANVKAAAR